MSSSREVSNLLISRSGRESSADGWNGRETLTLQCQRWRLADQHVCGFATDAVTAAGLRRRGSSCSVAHLVLMFSYDPPRWLGVVVGAFFVLAIAVSWQTPW